MAEPKPTYDYTKEIELELEFENDDSNCISLTELNKQIQEFKTAILNDFSNKEEDIIPFLNDKSITLEISAGHYSTESDLTFSVTLDNKDYTEQMVEYNKYLIEKEAEKKEEKRKADAIKQSQDLAKAAKEKSHEIRLEKRLIQIMDYTHLSPLEKVELINKMVQRKC